MNPPKTDPLQWIVRNQYPLHGPYNPLHVIGAVNGFVPMGKEKALSVMEDYVGRVSHLEMAGIEAQVLFLVLRCLFEIPEPPGYMPTVMIGAPYPPEPTDRRLIPRFPLVLMQDIPLHLDVGYILAGVPQSPLAHISYFREQGTIRSKPVIPTLRPLDILAKLEASPQWIYGKPYRATKNGIDDAIVQMTNAQRKSSERRLREQLLCLVASVYPLKAYSSHGSRLPYPDADGERVWQKAVHDLARMPINWDVGRNEYVRI